MQPCGQGAVKKPASRVLKEKRTKKKVLNGRHFKYFKIEFSSGLSNSKTFINLVSVLPSTEVW